MEKFRSITKLKKIFSDQRGMAAVFAIMVLLMISLWGVATLTLSTNEYHISNSSKKAVQAYYLAEAGIEEALANFYNNPENTVDFTNTLETGNVIITQTGTVSSDETRTITLNSKGTVDGVQRTLTLDLEVIGLGDGPPAYEDCLDDFHSWEDLYFGSNENINSNIFVGDELEFNSNNVITGDIYVGGNAVFNSLNTVNGNIFVEGDLEFNTNTTINGNVYVKGNVTFNNNTDIYGDLYCLGNLVYNKHFSISGTVYSGGEWNGDFDGGYQITPTEWN